MSDLPAASPDEAVLTRHLLAVMDGVNAFGADPRGGWSRLAFTEADMAARRWLRDHLAGLGLAARLDAVGNVIARRAPPDRPAIMLGSHTDTVAQGGAFDGVFGVAAAVAALMAAEAMGLPEDCAVEIVSFADEEGRFGGMLGSQTLSGQVTPDWIAAAQDADGVRLTEAMAAVGLDAWAALSLGRPRGAVTAYLETHVEQGPVLEGAGAVLGVAPSITGVCVTQITLTGQANHSGTTPMDRRQDALAAAAQAIAALPQALAAIGAPEARVTVGKLEIAPNAPHTIPGWARFTTVLRDADPAAMRALEAETGRLAKAAADAHGVGCAIERLSWLDPTQLDPGLAALALRCAADQGVPALRVPSGAGHDAQSMQALCPSALLFAPSRGGISHAPEEHTALAAMTAVAAVLARLLMVLAAGGGDPHR
jgi:N-carbamoyl-L-amino-acid hydrolase